MKEKTTEKNEKIKYGFRIHQEISDMIDKHIDKANTQTRSEFIEEAIRFYCCELDQTEHRNIITAETSRVIRDNIQNLENHLSYILYKIAGEQANMGLILADQLLDLPDEAIREIRNDAYDLIRKRSGFISFQDAIKNAREVSEGSDS